MEHKKRAMLENLKEEGAEEMPGGITGGAIPTRDAK